MQIIKNQMYTLANLLRNIFDIDYLHGYVYIHHHLFVIISLHYISFRAVRYIFV